jgi:TPR repeat protein
MKKIFLSVLLLLNFAFSASDDFAYDDFIFSIPNDFVFSSPDIVLFKVAFEFMRNGEVEKAIEIINPIARNGENDDSIFAQYFLSLAYYKNGITQDYKYAASWSRKSAELGYEHAQYMLGYLNYFGKGVEKNRKEAAYWYKESAEQGHREAQFRLGHLYYTGLGVIKDYKKALKWFRLAAKQNHPYSLENIGHMYDKGIGVEINKIKAFNYYVRAIKEGLSRSQKELDNLCRESPWACK